MSDCWEELEKVATQAYAEVQAYERGRADENKRVVEILHNFYEVRNPEQNAFMDRLVMEVMREQLKEQK